MDATIAAALIPTVGSLLTAAIAMHSRRQMAVVRAEVKNSHSTNLREDVDKVLAKLDDVIDGQHQHDAEIAGLRADMRIERQERLALASRLR
jgi:hypothetical protein